MGSWFPLWGCCLCLSPYLSWWLPPASPIADCVIVHGLDGTHLQGSSLQVVQALQRLEHGRGPHVCRPQVSSWIAIGSPSFLGVHSLMSLVLVLVSGSWVLSCLAIFSLELKSGFLVFSLGSFVSSLTAVLRFFFAPLGGDSRVLGICLRCLWEVQGVYPLVWLSLGSAAAPGDLQEYSSGAGAASWGAFAVSVFMSCLCELWRLPVVACTPVAWSSLALHLAVARPPLCVSGTYGVVHFRGAFAQPSLLAGPLWFGVVSWWFVGLGGFLQHSPLHGRSRRHHCTLEFGLDAFVSFSLPDPGGVARVLGPELKGFRYHYGHTQEEHILLLTSWW